MSLIATTNVSAHINGRDIRLTKGETFKGTEREANRLLAMGLLAKPAPAPVKEEKEVSNGR